MPLRQQDENEPPEQLFADVLDLVDKTVARVTDAEVGEHLRRVLNQTGHDGQSQVRVRPGEPLTPEDVRNKQFSTTRLRPGYDEEEVDDFLDQVEAGVDWLIQENEELRAKLAEVLRGGKSAVPAFASPPPKLAIVRHLPRRPTSSHRPSVDPRVVRGPDPWAACTPEEYVHQLRALRAWGGNPSVREVYAHAPEPGFYSSRSAFYDALSPRRTSLPPLKFVQMLVRACDADVEEWVSAWRALSLSEFEKANPSPIPADWEDSSTGPVTRIGTGS
jgi:DivIVA domain-containing protein